MLEFDQSDWYLVCVRKRPSGSASQGTGCSWLLSYGGHLSRDVNGSGFIGHTQMGPLLGLQLEHTCTHRWNNSSGCTQYSWSLDTQIMNC